MSRATEPLSSRSLIALAVVAAIAHAQAVRAQDAAATPPLEEVTVTGSSIKRGDDAALPVTIVSQEAMELRDASTPVDLLTAMPAVVNVPINDSNQGGVSARGDIASVNLRGLGSGNTLVLLNGRRVAVHGISSTEDGVRRCREESENHRHSSSTTLGATLFSRRSRRNDWSREDLRRLRELAATGTPLNAIAAALRRTSSAVRNKAGMQGISLRASR